MATYKTTKNLLEDKDTYNRYYGGFKGVDFSSDHTQVNEQRFAYLINLYKDYQASQGQAIETIPGFRRRVVLPNSEPVYGIFYYTYKNVSGESTDDVLIHAGEKLYLWDNYPNSVNIPCTVSITITNATLNEETSVYECVLDLSDIEIAQYISLKTSSGEDITASISENGIVNNTLTFYSSLVEAGDTVLLTYYENVLTEDDAILSNMNETKSTAFMFNNKLYIIDGKNYLVCYRDEDYELQIKNVTDDAYIPTTYINIDPSEDSSSAGEEYEQRNILSPYFINTFIADGEAIEFYLSESGIEKIVSVTVDGAEVETGYTVNEDEGLITFENPPSATSVQGQANIEVKVKKAWSNFSGVSKTLDDYSTLITNCTIATIFDNRVFLSGNPDCPNYIFFCGIGNGASYTDPSYFGVLNYMQDGVGISPITGMIPVADTLLVLKKDTRQEGSTFFHTRTDTDDNVVPVTYPSSQGLNGVGCLGACVNFLDDPIFISRLGVEAVGQLSVRYERAIEHRSSLIDAKLVNMNLEDAMVIEWNGYLIVLVDGYMFLADSRQVYTHDIGVNQYEWYYAEGIGVYENQYYEYKYSSSIPDEFQGVTVNICQTCGKPEDECTCDGETSIQDIVEVPIKLASAVYEFQTNETSDLTGEIANAPDDNGNETKTVYSQNVEFEVEVIKEKVDDEGNIEEYSDTETFNKTIYFVTHKVYAEDGSDLGYEALLCEREGNYTGGEFKKATTIANMYDNIFFGTENGVVCSFNFDKRDDDGNIALQWYSFDDRTINSGCATKMDNCSIPHLTKNTIKKSTVIKTKSMRNSAAKVKVRTNKEPYKQIARINSNIFTFEDLDFSDLTFNVTDESLFSVKEKEKRWVEKQYFVYSDEYRKPFAIYYIAYRYRVIGRYKGK